MKDVFHISPVKGNTILIFKGCFFNCSNGDISMEQAKNVIPLHGYHTQQALQNLSGPTKGNKLLFEIEKSLNVNPPNYGNGIVHVERRIVKLADLITKNDKGISLQPREKDQAEEEHETLKNSYLTYGVMYDKEVMVCKLRKDGLLELHSGYNRLWVFLNKLGITHYFVDVVTYTSPFMEALWKRRFNASKDHVGKGTPNTQGSLLLGLDEAKAKESFEWTDDSVVKEALRFMSAGSKTEPQIEALLKKWRETNNPNPHIRGLNTVMANTLSELLEIPFKGYSKDMSKSYFGRSGYNKYGSFSTKIKEYVDQYDKYGQTIEIYGFVQHVIANKIKDQRQAIVDEINDDIAWIKSHLQRKYHKMVKFAGFHAQIRTPNPFDDGKPKERGIVDVDGLIIIDLDY